MRGKGERVMMGGEVRGGWWGVEVRGVVMR